MDLKIILLISFILTVRGEDSQFEDGKKDYKNKENNEQNNSIEQNNEKNKKSDTENMENKDQEQHLDMSNNQNIENKDQLKPMNVSNEQDNVNKEQGQSTDSPNDQNIENKDKPESMNMSDEQNNKNEEQKEPNNQNIENKDQEQPKEKPTNQNIENQDQLKPMNISNEQDNVNKEQGQSTDSANNQNIENKDKPESMGMTDEQNNKNEEQKEPNNQNIENKDQVQPTEKPNNQNIENKDQLKPMNMSNEQDNVKKEQGQTTDSPNNQNIENKVKPDSMKMSDVQNNENEEQKKPNNINIENKNQEQPVETPNNQNIENKDQLKTMNITNEQNNENKEQQNNTKNGKLESQGQNINELTNQINLTKYSSEENFNKMNKDLENQESNISFTKQVYENGEEKNKSSVNRQNNTSSKEEKPNIVVIMADDLGWNDFSYHGSDQILTPNIDVVAYQGVVLQQHYTDAYGTPSRSAFFTGKYPFRLGTQGESILASEDRGLPTYERLLPSYLKDLGYTTHLIGKWSLGKSREHFLPTNRGFDTFFGFLDSAVDYYTYHHVESWNNTEYFGLDLYNNRIPAENIKGHLTEVLTDQAVQLIREHPVSYPMYLQVSHAAPHAGGGLVNLQPPVDEIAKNDHIAHTARRLYAGMVTSLDNSVGKILIALAEKQILNNTIIVFLTDNGAATVGPTQNYGSNLPLRGVKSTPWEGGVRSSAIIWHHKVKSNIWDGLFHITDWLPTLVSAAGGNVTTALDGVNQWQAINNNGVSKRNDVLITVDDLNGWAAMIEGDYKIIIGNAITDELSGYGGKDLMEIKYDPPIYSNVLLDCETAKVMGDMGRELDVGRAFLKRNDTLLIEIGKVNLSELCVPTGGKGCLFNIKEDPLEAHDVWAASPDIVKRLTLRLRTMWAELKPRAKPVRDDRCNPARSNYVWTQWLENDEPHPETLLFPATFPLQASKAELQYLVDINMNAFKDKIFEYVQGMGNSFVKSVSGLFNF